MIVTRQKENCNFRLNIGGHEISQRVYQVFGGDVG